MSSTTTTVSLGRRVPAVRHGAGGQPLDAQPAVHALGVLAHLHRQLGALHHGGQERVRQLRSGDPGQIPAEGESTHTLRLKQAETARGIYFLLVCLFSVFIFYASVHINST